jgi:hypothetical protein
MRFPHGSRGVNAPGRNRTYETFPPSRSVGDRIPGRVARVLEIRTEDRGGQSYVVYELSDSLRKPEGKPASARADWRRAA